MGKFGDPHQNPLRKRGAGAVENQNPLLKRGEWADAVRG